MIYKLSLNIALVVFVVGVCFRAWRWFTHSVSVDHRSASPLLSAGTRIEHALRGFFRALFSANILKLIKSLFLDVLLQLRIIRKDGLRWVMHFSIFIGFILLLCMHALEAHISKPLFSGYESTLNPYLFLRNLFGFWVLLGLGIALYRRWNIQTLKQITTLADYFILAIIAVIIASGFLLEAAKIISAPVFNQMVDDYARLSDPETEVIPLKLYWAKEFGVAFPNDDLPPVNDDLLEEGEALHIDNSCAECHSKPDWAFISYPLSQAIRPAAKFFENFRADRVLWYIHFLSCFIGLALLPFTKLFHIFSTPFSLLVNSVYQPEVCGPVNTVTRRVIDLDGCTHCGACSLNCSVAPLFSLIPNQYILPSEKLAALRKFIGTNPLSESDLNSFAAGNYICTGCYRCTQHCPSGLNLQDLWLNATEDLARRGLPHPGAIMMKQAEAVDINAGRIWPVNPGLRKKILTLVPNIETFRSCFKCRTCTNSCPVVAGYKDLQENLDFAPHQVMHGLGLGLSQVISSKMVWACTTCYLCQESCPQGVKITDIFYELKNYRFNQYRSTSQDIDQS